MNILKMKYIKKEIRILGIDDSPFNKFKEKKVLVVGTIFRGGEYIDGLLSCYVDIDGGDATTKLIKMIRKTKHLGQLQCIMLDGIAFGGFNIIDIQQLSKKTKLPVIVIIRRRPNLHKIEEVLKKIRQQNKIKLLKKAGKVNRVKIKNRNIYFQNFGISVDLAEKIIKKTSTHSLIPEPIRAAHLIASGIKLGESRGRA